MKNIIDRLAEGNRLYLAAIHPVGDISKKIRLKTAQEGQFPYAVIVTCSDSRVIPEDIFSAGIGDLFVIRVAGNVIDKHQLGSIEYAAAHLGCKMVLILGHTGCGAVAAALAEQETKEIKSCHKTKHKDENESGKESDSYIHFLTDEIKKAAGSETDPDKVTCLNALNSMHIVRKALGSKKTAAQYVEETHALTAAPAEDSRELKDVTVVAGIYHIDDGRVEFLED